MDIGYQKLLFTGIAECNYTRIVYNFHAPFPRKFRTARNPRRVGQSANVVEARASVM